MQSLKEIFSKVMDIDPSRLSNTDLLNLIISTSSLAVAVLSFAVAMIALIYTGYQFLLKKGTSFYGIFGTSASVWSKQRYVSDIIIENKKDKSATISYIYLRIGSNIHLELVNYEMSPRVIAPFETIKIDLRKGVSGYISSTYKVDIDSLLANRKIRKTLLVVTPQGVSKVKKYKKFWNIYVESLRNNFIIPVHPVRKYHKGKEYSDALQFVATTKNSEGLTQESFLYRGNTYTINDKTVIVDNFTCENELEEFLRPPEGSTTVTVERVGYTYGDYADYPSRDVFHSGPVGTHIIGKGYTKISSWAFRLKNKIKAFKNR
ncbi:hypothetical protein [Pseudomonas sp. BP01]|uniref:hypothetical protein n=1 Tax=Pseudomonas sp. BP01 TaxID=2976152 RepID=UPI001FA96EA8|nr:hypothetical protein [Pseudomonas sp. BP01]